MNFNKRTIRLVLFALVAIAAIVGCDVTGGDLGLDTTAPTVSSTLPANQASNVAVDAAISATFDKAMDSATITTTSFTLSSTAGAVAGTVSYDADTAIAQFHPTADLVTGGSYMATITVTATDEAGNALTANKVWAFTTAPPVDATAPTVTATLPAHLATNVAVATQVTATFSEAMDSATITGTSFTLSTASGAVAGTVSYDAETVTAKLIPTASLAAGVLHTATIAATVTDQAGNALVESKIWTFTVATPVDTTAPTVTSTFPVDQATNAAVDSEITATFSEAIDGDTITGTSFTLSADSGAVAGTVSYDAATVTAKFVPTANLAAGVSYMATITTSVTDVAGNSKAASEVWSFTVATPADTTPPTVTSTVPAHESINIAIDTDITGTFSEAMVGATITPASFTLSSVTGAVSGTVTYDAVTFTAKFSPVASLATDVTYTATIKDTVTDQAGNTMAQNKTWTFTTVPPETLGAGPDGGPAAVNLADAGNYAVLAESGVSTTGTTMVTGDIGVSPAAADTLTGFSQTMHADNQWSTSEYVVGNLFAADYTEPTPSNLTVAVDNMHTAYTSAAGLTTPDATDLGEGEIGGLTLEPGLYKWGTGVSISTNLTLYGSATATWVFQIAETLTVASGVQVVLTGGALPENIVWQIGSQAILGTTAKMVGVLLAKTLIEVRTGASVNGRLLSQTAVTMDANAVTEP